MVWLGPVIESDLNFYKQKEKQKKQLILHLPALYLQEADAPTPKHVRYPTKPTQRYLSQLVRSKCKFRPDHANNRKSALTIRGQEIQIPDTAEGHRAWRPSRPPTSSKSTTLSKQFRTTPNFRPPAAPPHHIPPPHLTTLPDHQTLVLNTKH